jgi:SAM-dependent methyltransferase
LYVQENRRDLTGPGRYGVVGQLLAGALQRVRPAEGPAHVLDCGGGSGSFAVPLAQAGAVVTVLDTSADALATLQRRAEEAGVRERIDALQGDVEDLAGALDPAARFDLVLAHDILGAVDDPVAAFAQLTDRVPPGGMLSVLVANPVAGVLSRALAGDLGAALAELRGVDLEFERLGPRGVQERCRAAGLLIDQVSGIGVFTELVPGSAVDAPGGRDALAELEAMAATHPPFSEIAARVHVLARRPARPR